MTNMPEVLRLGIFNKYKWELKEPWEYDTKITGYHIKTQYITLYKNGKLSFRKGYRWDGASGPTIDTLSCRRGALVHDGLYQILRTGELPQDYKDDADHLLYELCVEDGMWKIRASIWYLGVHLFGSNSCKPDNWWDK